MSEVIWFKTFWAGQNFLNMGQLSIVKFSSEKSFLSIYVGQGLVLKKYFWGFNKPVNLFASTQCTMFGQDCVRRRLGDAPYHQKLQLSQTLFEVEFISSYDNQHTTYSWNIMCQKWEGDCGLWVLNEIIKKIYAESLYKIVGAVWELPAK